MYKTELLNKWNMTENECEKAIEQITIKGMRLTHDEKDDIFFFIQEGLINADDIEAQRKHVEFDRQTKAQMQEDDKLIKEFVKEWKRLETKYCCFDYEDKTLDELCEMWASDYFELYFIEEHLDLIKYYGAKEYAQVYCNKVGVCPDSEVSMWA